MKYDIYIAGPFFNSEQVRYMARIEESLWNAGRTLYSPRLHSGSRYFTEDQRKSHTEWATVMQANKQALLESRCILAVLDWIPNANSQIVEYHIDGVGFSSFGPPLNIPDSGTIWEIGYVVGYNDHAMSVLGQKLPVIPVFVFYQGTKNKLNLMLSHSIDGIIYGFDQLRAFTYKSEYEFSYQLYEKKNIPGVSKFEGEVE